MNEITKKYIYDIYISITSIKEFLNTIDNYDKYHNNKLIKRAVEREFEIIGEALNNAIKKEPDLSITQYQRIISFRNYLIHGYADISDKVVWSIIQQNLPVLENEITLLYYQFLK